MKRYLLPIFLFLSACASIPKGMDDFTKESYIRNGEFEKVLQDMEIKLHYVSDNDLLLAKLNYASALHYAGRYQKSNQVFTECQQMIDWGNDLSTAEEIVGAVLSPSVRRFQLDEYEILTISFMKMLNSLMMGNMDQARSESWRLDKLGRFLAQHKKENLLEQASFHYYFTGLLWDSLKHTDYQALENSYVNYKRAYNNNSDIPYLPFNLTRVATLTGRTEDEKKWISNPKLQEKYVRFIKSKSYKDTGELVIIFESGFGPDKASDPATNDLFLKTIPRVKKALKLKVQINGENYGETVPMLDIDKLAEENLQRRKNGVLAHIGNAVGVVNIHDTRSWNLIPQQIQIARVSLNKGTYPLQLEVIGENWHFIKKKVIIKPGERTFLRIYEP